MGDTSYERREYWESVAAEIGRRDSDLLLAGEATPFYRAKRQLFIDSLFKPAIEATDGTLLEVGCGPGGNLELLERLGRKAFGVDLAATMLRQASTRDITGLVQADAIALPMASRSVDSVFTVTVLQHNDDVAAARILDEIARVSRRQVHLFEDTGVFAVHDRPSHWLRRPRWYVSAIERAGFRLETKQRVAFMVSEVMANAVRAVGRRGRPEGEAVTPMFAHVERLLLAMTGSVDRLLPPAVGLTRLSFRRDLP